MLVQKNTLVDINRYLSRKKVEIETEFGRESYSHLLEVIEGALNASLENAPQAAEWMLRNAASLSKNNIDVTNICRMVADMLHGFNITDEEQDISKPFITAFRGDRRMRIPVSQVLYLEMEYNPLTRRGGYADCIPRVVVNDGNGTALNLIANAAGFVPEVIAVRHSVIAEAILSAWRK